MVYSGGNRHSRQFLGEGESDAVRHSRPQAGRERPRYSSGQVPRRAICRSGQDRCLYVFSTKEFESVNETIRQAPITSKQARDYLRIFLSGASDEIPDKQGRVTIPPTLRSYAGLGKELVVIGVGSRAEIWDSAAWSEYLAKQENSFSEISEEVVPGLF